MRSPFCLALALLAASCAAPLRGDVMRGRWVPQESGTTASLRGVCAVDTESCWASGSGGTVLRTIDRGETWELVPVPGAEALDFRDVQAFDAETALVISAGSPAEIHGTSDGGRTWTRHFRDEREGVFFDSFDFWDRSRGLAFSDPVDGSFLVIATDDGGVTWTRVDPAHLPVPLVGEAGFAASGTCLVVGGERHAWIGTGGGPKARVLASSDSGSTWSVAETPLRSGAPSAGVFSLAFLNPDQLVAVGGDYRAEDDFDGTSAVSWDGGRSWLPSESPLSGYRSAVAFVPFASPGSCVAVGPTGVDASDDAGLTWTRIGDVGYHALSFSRRDGSGWAVGSGGRIGRYDDR